MKFTKYALPLIAVCTSLAFVQTASANSIKDDASFNQEMGSLEYVAQEQAYLASAPNFEKTDIILDVQTDMKDIYLNQQQAKDMELQEVRTFNVYSAIDEHQLSDTIAKMIRKDDPTYFSVEVSSHLLGDSDMVEYLAKVTEYK